MQLTKVRSIRKFKTNLTVYDVQTESHTLNVNGVWIHNCSGNSPLYLLRNGIKIFLT